MPEESASAVVQVQVVRSHCLQGLQGEVGEFGCTGAGEGGSVMKESGVTASKVLADVWRRGLGVFGAVLINKI